MKDNTLEALKPRTKPDVQSMIEDIRKAMTRAGSLEFFSRMEQNHWYRHTFWEGQDWSGKKKVGEGTDPRKVFPWPGASDSRIPLVDEIINERVDVLTVAYDLARFRVAPRDLSTDEGAQNKAATWQAVANYYQDEEQEAMRTAVVQWADWAEEFGHAVLYCGWKEELALERKSVSEQDLQVMLVSEALNQATAARVAEMEAQGMQPPPEGDPVLLPQEQENIAQAVMVQLALGIQDPALIDGMVGVLMRYDEAITEDEARRVVRALRAGEPAEYFAPYVRQAAPCWRPLMPYIDALYPPEVRRLEDAPWVAMPEWLTAVELEERVAREGWDRKWVNALMEHPGRAFNFGAEQWGGKDWVMAGGMIGSTVNAVEQEKTPLYQVLHVYFKATAMSGVPCCYHTVLSGWVPDTAGLHEPCPYAHGKLPFIERCREVRAKTLLQSRGVGEISFSDQVSLKTHRDQLNDHASLQLLPPALVSLLHASGQVPMLRPGAQIPSKLTGPQGEPIRWLKPPGDPTISKNAETEIRNNVDRYWARGAAVDPEVKLTRQRARVTSFLMDVRKAWKQAFQLIQEYAPEELRITATRGLPVDITATRADIQGQVSMDLTFDPADLDMGQVMQKLQVLVEGLLPLDRTGSLNTHSILRAATAAVLPQWVGEILPKTSDEVLAGEIEDEDNVLTKLLAGQEQPYVEGKDHNARKGLLLERLNARNPDGSPTRVQRTMQENPDVAELVMNRIKFHDFQLQQQQNAVTGRRGVNQVQQVPEVTQ